MQSCKHQLVSYCMASCYYMYMSCTCTDVHVEHTDMWVLETSVYVMHAFVSVYNIGCGRGAKRQTIDSGVCCESTCRCVGVQWRGAACHTQNVSTPPAHGPVRVFVYCAHARSTMRWRYERRVPSQSKYLCRECCVVMALRRERRRPSLSSFRALCSWQGWMEVDGRLRDILDETAHSTATTTPRKTLIKPHQLSSVLLQQQQALCPDQLFSLVPSSGSQSWLHRPQGPQTCPWPSSCTALRYPCRTMSDWCR